MERGRTPLIAVVQNDIIKRSITRATRGIIYYSFDQDRFRDRYSLLIMCPEARHSFETPRWWIDEFQEYIVRIGGLERKKRLRLVKLPLLSQPAPTGASLFFYTAARFLSLMYFVSTTYLGSWVVVRNLGIWKSIPLRFIDTNRPMLVMEFYLG